MNTIQVTAGDIEPGDTLVNLDNGYVVGVVRNNGYLSYPSLDYGRGVAMPADTMVITFHDADGNEQHLLLSDDFPLTISKDYA